LARWVIIAKFDVFGHHYPNDSTARTHHLNDDARKTGNGSELE